MAAPPGTFLSLPWFQLLPGAEKGWFAERVLAGFVDDEREPLVEFEMHEPRFPGQPLSIQPLGLPILHYQTAEPDRWRSKQRWYQCLERLKFPDKRPAELYRQYHERDPAIRADIVPTPSELLRGYEEAGIDMRSVVVDCRYRWDSEVLRMFADHGHAFFRKLDIWDTNWPRIANEQGIVLPTAPVDPRSSLDRIMFRWLRFAQPRRRSPVVRAVSRALRLAGW
jgi:hypothetical protein